MMNKERLLVIGPIAPQAQDINHICRPLQFLEHHYQIHAIDPLTEITETAHHQYYPCWQQYLTREAKNFAAFIGFSFGGIILQQNLPTLAAINKPILLFSTPSYVNKALSEKLLAVIDCCKHQHLLQALQALYKPVFSPNPIPKELLNTQVMNEKEACRRLIWGLTQVLMTDSRDLLLHTRLNYTHLIGAQSDLVNKENVIKAPTMSLLEIPHAGMRVLQDNPEYCQPIIWEALGHEIA
ncbi:MAG: hypothetical protein J0I93_05150 [Legionella sp.]|nr:hypothetical protein [Legionella sp.]